LLKKPAKNKSATKISLIGFFKNLLELVKKPAKNKKSLPKINNI
jgi:hypothetical protein